nr:type II secretion system protein N [uncultured Sphingosinicella sp.]
MATAAPPRLPMLIRQRLAALSPRERVFLGLGAAALLAFLFYLMLRDGSEEPVELIGTPPLPPASVAAPVTYAPPPPPPASMQPAATTGGLVLIGVFGGGPGGGTAVIATPDGVQRRIPVGREFQPGLTLKAVGIDHVILGSASGDQKLEFGKAGATAVVSAPPPPAGASPPASDAIRRAETMAYRLGLQPVKSDGRVTGHQIKAGANLPHLDQAGLVAGDVILSVNGSVLNEEQLMELSWTIANSNSTEFEVLRDGRKIKLALQR